jgi:hypothetical protein
VRNGLTIAALIEQRELACGVVVVMDIQSIKGFDKFMI